MKTYQHSNRFEVKNRINSIQKYADSLRLQIYNINRNAVKLQLKIRFSKNKYNPTNEETMIIFKSLEILMKTDHELRNLLLGQYNPQRQHEQRRKDSDEAIK